MLAVNEMQVLNEGRFATPIVCVIITDTKAQVAISACRNFKRKDPLQYVCWLCGQNRLCCLGAFGQGISILLKVWQCGGMTLPGLLPFQRPLDFGLHGALCGQWVGYRFDASPWVGEGEGIGLGAVVLG